MIKRYRERYGADFKCRITPFRFHELLLSDSTTNYWCLLMILGAPVSFITKLIWIVLFIADLPMYIKIFSQKDKE